MQLQLLKEINKELEYLEQQIQRIKRSTEIIKLEQKNTYMINEFEKILNDYSQRPSLDAQELVSKIKRIFYKINESKEVQHGERPDGTQRLGRIRKSARQGDDGNV